MRLHLVRSVVLGVLLSLVAASTVQAADPAGSIEAPYVPDSAESTPGSDSVSAATNPYGCVQRSDLPHLSGHFPGSATAQSIGTCNYTMARLYIRGTLSRQDCFFFVCWWTQVDQKSKTLTNYWKVNVNPSYVCNGSSPSHKFRLDTYGEMTGYNGVTYYATTASESGSLSCG